LNGYVSCRRIETRDGKVKSGRREISNRSEAANDIVAVVEVAGGGPIIGGGSELEPEGTARNVGDAEATVGIGRALKTLEGAVGLREKREGIGEEVQVRGTSTEPVGVQ
jgi:hypothetical protein